MYDKKQAKDLQKKSPRESYEQRFMPLIRMVLGTSEIVTPLMTESPAWNRYLQILQGLMEQIKDSRVYANNQLNNPEIWDPSKLAMLKSEVRMFDGQIKLLEDVMKLPKALLDSAIEIRDLQEEIEAKYGKSTDTKKTES